MERREELGHPLGTVPPAADAPPATADVAAPPSAAADFVLEVGCEELPPDDVRMALEQLRCLETRRPDVLLLHLNRQRPMSCRSLRPLEHGLVMESGYSHLNSAAP